MAAPRGRIFATLAFLAGLLFAGGYITQYILRRRRNEQEQEGDVTADDGVFLDAARDEEGDHKSWVSGKYETIYGECQIGEESKCDKPTVRFRTSTPPLSSPCTEAKSLPDDEPRQDSGAKTTEQPSEQFSSMGSSVEMISMSMLESCEGLSGSESIAEGDQIHPEAVSPSLSENNESGDKSIIAELMRATTITTAVPKPMVSDDTLLHEEGMKLTGIEATASEEGHPPSTDMTEQGSVEAHSEDWQDPQSVASLTSGLLQATSAAVVIATSSTDKEVADPEQPHNSESLNYELNPQVVDYISVQMNQPGFTESEDITSVMAPTESETLTIVEETDEGVHEDKPIAPTELQETDQTPSEAVTPNVETIASRE